MDNLATQKRWLDIRWIPYQCSVKFHLCSSHFMIHIHYMTIISLLSMADGGPWWRAKISPYCPLCGAVIADYGGNTSSIGRYSPLQWAQKPPPISAMAPPSPIFDNTGLYHYMSKDVKKRNLQEELKIWNTFPCLMNKNQVKKCNKFKILSYGS